MSFTDAKVDFPSAPHGPFRNLLCILKPWIQDIDWISKDVSALKVMMVGEDGVGEYFVEIFNAVGTQTLAHLITLVLPAYLAYISYMGNT